MKKILILGVTGLIGKAVVEALNKDYKIVGLSRSPSISDYRDWETGKKKYTPLAFDMEKDKITPLLRKVKPDLIVSCTRGDFEAQLTTHRDIACYAKSKGAKVFYFSTANVFDGDPTEQKTEFAERKAVSDYGRFKIACEDMLRDELGDNAVVLRLPMVFGDNAPRVEEMKRAALRESTITVYENLKLTIAYDRDVASALKFLLENGYTGTYHLTCNDLINHKDLYETCLGDSAQLVVDRLDEHSDYYLALYSTNSEIERHLMTNQAVISKIKECIESD